VLLTFAAAAFGVWSMTKLPIDAVPDLFSTTHRRGRAAKPFAGPERFDDFDLEARKRLGESHLKGSNSFFKKGNIPNRVESTSTPLRGLKYRPDARPHEAGALKYRREYASSMDRR
jgi:hypothetical protein